MSWREEEQRVEMLEEHYEGSRKLLSGLLQRAYMRLDYGEADEIADFLGVKRPTDHEMEDLR